MALEFNTAGFALKYAVEASVGAGRPTTGYTNIEGVVSLSEMNSAPTAIDITPLAELKKHRYIPGLSDDGGVFTVRANGTTAFNTAWSTLVTAAETAQAAGKRTFFEIVFPTSSGYSDSYYFEGLPVTLGFFGAEVDTAYQGDCYIITNEILGFAAKSTT